jgi:hypothetical protein
MFPRNVVGVGRPGLALIALSVVEQRLDAVRSVSADASVTEVPSRLVSRQHGLGFALGVAGSGKHAYLSARSSALKAAPQPRMRCLRA